MSKSKLKSPLTGPLRDAIAASGLPLLRVSNDAGVQRASLVRFMQGKTSLRLDIADKLADYFGLELQAKRKGK